MHHVDPEVDRAITTLLDVLCSWERSTGRETFLVLIPVEKEEEVIVAESGKLISKRLCYKDLIVEEVANALDVHNNPDVHRFIDGP